MQVHAPKSPLAKALASQGCGVVWTPSDSLLQLQLLTNLHSSQWSRRLQDGAKPRVECSVPENRKACVWKREPEHQARHGSQGCWVSHPQHKQRYLEAFVSGIKKEKGRSTMKHHMQVPLEDTKGELHTGSTQHTPCSRSSASQKRGWRLGCPGVPGDFCFLERWIPGDWWDC